jgi:glycerol-3-phosphate dehydrogenase subunit C
MRWILDWLLGLDKRRPLPDFEVPTFRQWLRRRPEGLPITPESSTNGRVGYFYGCFTNISEVDVGKAVIQVLEENGVRVVIPEQDCCGIPMLGSGDLKSARAIARKNVTSLKAAIGSGMDIVFSSSSCGYMIRHEYTNVLGIPGAEEVSEKTYDIFEYLMARHERGSLKGPSETRRRLAYFAPCHVRAVGMGLPALELVRLIPGIHIEFVRYLHGDRKGSGQETLGFEPGCRGDGLRRVSFANKTPHGYEGHPSHPDPAGCIRP